MGTREKPDIEEVLEYYGFEIPHHARHRGQKIKCALHGDRQASAVYNKDKDTFHCFSCGRKGDSWALIMDEEGIDFKTAIEFAQERDWLSGDEVSGGTSGGGWGGGSILSSGARPERRVGRAVRTRRRRRA